MTFRIEKGTVDVTSHSPDLGEAKERLPVAYEGPALHVCFNAQHVLDCLSMVTTDAVSLDLTDDVSPAVIKPIGAEDGDYTYVIMPLRP